MRSESSLSGREIAAQKEPGAERASAQDLQSLLSTYRRIPPSDRNWRRDKGFQALPENEKHAEFVREAIRDTRLLSETLRHAVLDVDRQTRLRDMLLEVEFELQKDSLDATQRK